MLKRQVKHGFLIDNGTVINPLEPLKPHYALSQYKIHNTPAVQFHIQHSCVQLLFQYCNTICIFPKAAAFTSILRATTNRPRTAVPRNIPCQLLGHISQLQENRKHE